MRILEDAPFLRAAFFIAEAREAQLFSSSSDMAFPILFSDYIVAASPFIPSFAERVLRLTLLAPDIAAPGTKTTSRPIRLA